MVPDWASAAVVLRKIKIASRCFIANAFLLYVVLILCGDEILLDLSVRHLVDRDGNDSLLEFCRVLLKRHPAAALFFGKGELVGSAERGEAAGVIRNRLFS